jgi:hypothetical protein
VTPDDNGTPLDVLVYESWGFGLDWDYGFPTPENWVLAVRMRTNSLGEYVPWPGCAARFGPQPAPPWWSRPVARLTRSRQLARVE